jgi:spore coat protein SA
MRIGIVNQPCDPMLPPYENSIAIWTNRVVPYLAKRHHVVVYARRMRIQKRIAPPPNSPYIFIRSLHHRAVTEAVKLLPKRGESRLPAYASALCSLDYSLPIALSIRGRKLDLVHVHNYSQFVPVIRALNPGVKIVLHMNCEWLTQLPHEEMARRVQMSDLVLGSSDYITQKIRERFPRYETRCQTVYNGVDVDTFKVAAGNGNGASIPDHKKRLLFVGRVSPEKGVHVLLEAFAIAAAQDPQLELDIVGYVRALPIEFIVNASDEPQVSALAKFYEQDYGIVLKQLVPDHLANRIRFLGPSPHNRIIAHYHGADILINPSYSESFGMSLVEAMATEKPVVATRVGGMTEIVDHGKSGLLVERGDPRGLAEAILYLARDSSLRREMGQRGRQRAEEIFAWPQVAARLQTYYEAL